jgi:hypothetical protein
MKKIMDEKVQQLYTVLLDKPDLLREAVNAQSPRINLGVKIRVDQKLNRGGWGLLQSLDLASDFLRLYEKDLQQYRR